MDKESGWGKLLAHTNDRTKEEVMRLRKIINGSHLLIALVAILALGISAPWAHADDLSGSLQIKGSDTMVNLAQAWAEEFMKEHPKTSIAVTGGGSGTGFASLINGTCDLALASRKISAKELALLEKRGMKATEHLLALDGIAVIVHPSNPVSELTIERLRDVFTGKIRDWAEVGGEKGPIVLLSRAVNSGTHVFFSEHVLTDPGSKRPGRFAPFALLLPSSQAIADEVSHNTGAIGYYGMGYVSASQKAIAVAQKTSGPFVAPAIEAVQSSSYPISRPLLIYTVSEDNALINALLEFAASPRGQEIVATTDFVPFQ
jgi:phosphate transport system substrate-binding protein